MVVPVWQMQNASNSLASLRKIYCCLPHSYRASFFSPEHCLLIFDFHPHVHSRNLFTSNLNIGRAYGGLFDSDTVWDLADRLSRLAKVNLSYAGITAVPQGGDGPSVTSVRDTAAHMDKSEWFDIMFHSRRKTAISSLLSSCTRRESGGQDQEEASQSHQELLR